MEDVKVVVLLLDGVTTIPVTKDPQERVPVPVMVAAVVVPAILFNVTAPDMVKVIVVFTVKVALAPLKVKEAAEALAVTVIEDPETITTSSVETGTTPPTQLEVALQLPVTALLVIVAP